MGFRPADPLASRSEMSLVSVNFYSRHRMSCRNLDWDQVMSEAGMQVPDNDGEALITHKERHDGNEPPQSLKWSYAKWHCVELWFARMRRKRHR